MTKQAGYIAGLPGKHPRAKWELTPELEQEILSWLESGRSLLEYCRQELKPSRATVLAWEHQKPDFLAKCALAREAGGDVAAEKLEDINEKLEAGLIDPAAARVISSNLQWMASKLKPKRYGDAMTLKGDKENPIELNLAVRLDKALQRANEPATIEHDPHEA